MERSGIPRNRVAGNTINATERMSESQEQAHVGQETKAKYPRDMECCYATAFKGVLAKIRAEREQDGGTQGGYLSYQLCSN